MLSDKLAQREFSLPSNLTLRRLLPEGAKAALREPLPPQLPPQLLHLAPPLRLATRWAGIEPAKAVQGLRVVALGLANLRVDVLKHGSFSSHAPVFCFGTGPPTGAEASLSSRLGLRLRLRLRLREALHWHWLHAALA